MPIKFIAMDLINILPPPSVGHQYELKPSDFLLDMSNAYNWNLKHV